ncbi:hypothetical protein MPTK1_4g14250 [Marchantia polymorpha subsp. ruderalis]|uniref:TauD/TfdA-like domain-containing protein n=2 Tax=Marchantia polymorpha TaxID=3197 RepID=A0AAF6B9S5_MARPO|nr:hypothetical protein MARPO_0070s0057 [Marchantia polymorpha]BBN08759.1 hypothetical protein Mp_4g14250 [Marchantia polymorpha subsp. ruderalis]|eukprot:PTQ35594.1 hypothetical protein MARPO_0070s0057 [Marchantia polymorpha]
MADHLLQEVEMHGQKPVNGGAPLPQVLAPADGREVTVDELVDWIKRDKSWIEEHLLHSGAVLIRGCDVKDAKDFNTVVEAFGYEERLRPGGGGLAPRTQVIGRIYTANEAPPHVYIPFHHEMAQPPTAPSKLFFFCELAPTKGGETPLLWSNSVVRRLQQECPDFLQQLDEKGLIYQLYFGDEDLSESYIQRSWKTLYKVNDRKELEDKLAKMGGDSRVEWIEGHGVKTIYGPLPALKWDEQRQQNVFFNYMVMKYFTEYPVLECDKEVAAFDNVMFGDGSPLPREQVLDCQRIMAEEMVEFKWERGDVILIDNVAVQHSKNPCFSPRRILASLVV